jgi:hypothetical protein
MSIERDPKPGRTKRGAGAGARLDLSIYYYRAADGEGPDYGAFYGRDEDGRWELHFANPSEMDGQFARVVAMLHDEATAARDDAMAEARPDGAPAVWLKAIGTVGWPADEIWWQDDRSRDECIRFPYRPRSIRPDDLMVIYAAGTGKLVGVVRAKGDWYEEGAEERWPYRIDTEIVVAHPISRGVPLASIRVERANTKSIRQKSPVRLSEAEASTALKALGVGELAAA